MTELAVSVRLALWVTTAWADGVDLEQACARAMPDIDDTSGDLGRLAAWHSLGERALLVALPRPGDPTSLPGCAPDAAHDATLAGEAVYVAGVGGLLVPHLREFGPPGDIGLAVHWQGHDADPVPRHRIEMLDVRAAGIALRTAMAEATDQLLRIGGVPWDGADLAAGLGHARWGLPAHLPSSAASVIESAATVARLCERGLEAERNRPALAASTSAGREQVLRRLSAQADLALSTATNAAVAVLARWRPA